MGNPDTWIVAIGLVLIAVYFSPVFIAFLREHRYRWAILGLCIALGWTAVGWAAAFAWAVWPGMRTIGDQEPDRAVAPQNSAPRGDRLDQLERLAKLKASAAISDAEFQTEKKKILCS
jgi:hypothetical protein